MKHDQRNQVHVLPAEDGQQAKSQKEAASQRRMNTNKLLQNMRSNWSPIVVIAITTLATIAISIYCLASGYFIIFQNLFYIPIIIACVYYTRRGFAFSVTIACLYFLLTLAFTRESSILLQAFVRVLIFVIVAGVITYLSLARRRGEESLRRQQDGLKGLVQERTAQLEADITSRKQAEAALFTEKNNLDAIFESSPVAMFVIDHTTNIVMTNLAFTVMCGGSESDILQHRPGNALRCVHSHSDPRGCGYAEACKYCNVRNGVESLIANGGSLHGAELELELIRKGESGKYWMNIGGESFKMNGQEHWCIAMDDVTQRKKVEEALRDNELKYRALFETSNVANLLFADGRWVDCNAGALRVFGCAREQIIGAHPSRFSPPTQPDGRSSEEEAIKRINLAFEGVPQFFEWEHCRVDGTPFAAEVSLNRLDLGGKPHMQAIVRDITERKQAEEALRESEAKFRQTFEFSPVGIVMVGLDKRFIRNNNAFSESLGYAPEELIGKTIADITYPDDVHIGMDEMKAIARGELAISNVQKRYLYKDGRIIWGEATISLIRDHKANPQYFMAIIQDISERKLAEAEVRQKGEELRARNDELEQFNRAMVGRELRMIELKEEINELCRRLGEPPRHALDQLQTDSVPGAGPAPAPPGGGGA